MQAGKPELILFSGNGNLSLSKDVAKKLKLKLGSSKVERFSDGEISVKIQENVRGMDVFLIQPTCPPTHENLMELVIMVDALKRSSASRITAVIPYYGYARQDRRVRSERVPISAKVVADILERSGIDRVLTVELHSEQIQGFFDIPVDNLFSTPIFSKHIKKKFNNKNLICVAPDVGGVERTRALARKLDIGIAIIDKRRPVPGKSQVMNVVGNVNGKKCIIVDDIIDSGGTIVNAAKALKDRGAEEVHVYVTHGVLSGEAVDKIKKSHIKNLVITDTIDNKDKLKKAKNIQVLTISNLTSEAIKRISNSTSVSDLFK